MIIKKFYDDVILFKNEKIKDSRGYNEIFDFKVVDAKFNIDRCLISNNKYRGTIRGIHYQKPYSEKKIIRVINGKIFDVFVNINPRSKDYMKFKFCTMDSNDQNMLFIGSDYAHGFQSLAKDTSVCYYICGNYKPDNAKIIRYDDPFLNIPWPLKMKKISKKDIEGKFIDE